MIVMILEVMVVLILCDLVMGVGDSGGRGWWPW